MLEKSPPPGAECRSPAPRNAGRVFAGPDPKHRPVEGGQEVVCPGGVLAADTRGLQPPGWGSGQSCTVYGRRPGGDSGGGRPRRKRTISASASARWPAVSQWRMPLRGDDEGRVAPGVCCGERVSDSSAQGSMERRSRSTSCVTGCRTQPGPITLFTH